MDRNLIDLIESNGLTLHGDIEHFAHLVAEEERQRCALLILKKSRQLDVPLEQAWCLTLIVQDWLAE